MSDSPTQVGLLTNIRQFVRSAANEEEEFWKNEAPEEFWEEVTQAQEYWEEHEVEEIWEEEEEFWKIEEEDPKAMHILEAEVIHARWAMLGTLGISRPALLSRISGCENGQVAVFKEVGLHYWADAGLMQALPLVTIIGYQAVLRGALEAYLMMVGCMTQWVCMPPRIY